MVCAYACLDSLRAYHRDGKSVPSAGALLAFLGQSRRRLEIRRSVEATFGSTLWRPVVESQRMSSSESHGWRAGAGRDFFATWTSGYNRERSLRGHFEAGGQIHLAADSAHLQDLVEYPGDKLGAARTTQ